MDKKVISLNEIGNDGKSVFLYYDTMAGMYLAFGLSAYYTTLVADPFMSYSEEMQMPVALLRREHILMLRQSMIKVEHEQKRFYHFETKRHVGEAGYEKWANKILSHYHIINK